MHPTRVRQHRPSDRPTLGCRVRSQIFGSSLLRSVVPTYKHLLFPALLLVSLLGGNPLLSHATVYQCPTAQGAPMYTDQGGPGCKNISSLRPISYEPHYVSPTPVLPIRTVRASAPVLQPGKPDQPAGLAAPGAPFQPATRTVPILTVADVDSTTDSLKFYVAQPGGTIPIRIEVRHLPDSTGPRVITAEPFAQGIRDSMVVAVQTAATAVRYQPANLAATFTVPAVFGAGPGKNQVDGPSGGGILTIGLIAALLGDPIREDVCMTGTILPNLTIGPVAASLDKVRGCQKLRAHEMLVPSGQSSPALERLGRDSDIKVTEVATLADAYQIVTGRPLRPFTD